MSKTKFRPSLRDCEHILKGEGWLIQRLPLRLRAKQAFGRSPWYLAHKFRYGETRVVLHSRLLFRNFGDTL